MVEIHVFVIGEDSGGRGKLRLQGRGGEGCGGSFLSRQEVWGPLLVFPVLSLDIFQPTSQSDLPVISFYIVSLRQKEIYTFVKSQLPEQPPQKAMVTSLLAQQH